MRTKAFFGLARVFRINVVHQEGEIRKDILRRGNRMYPDWVAWKNVLWSELHLCFDTRFLLWTPRDRNKGMQWDDVSKSVCWVNCVGQMLDMSLLPKSQFTSYKVLIITEDFDLSYIAWQLYWVCLVGTVFSEELLQKLFPWVSFSFHNELWQGVVLLHPYQQINRALLGN